VTQTLHPGLPCDAARRGVRDQLALRPLPLDESLVERAWVYQVEARLSFWHAPVVSAANCAGCAYLLTEDLQDGRDFEGTRVLNPFLHSADEVA
jgi:predicted nucleic acid-binding protein